MTHTVGPSISRHHIDPDDIDGVFGDTGDDDHDRVIERATHPQRSDVDVHTITVSFPGRSSRNRQDRIEVVDRTRADHCVSVIYGEDSHYLRRYKVLYSTY